MLALTKNKNIKLTTFKSCSDQQIQEYECLKIKIDKTKKTYSSMSHINIVVSVLRVPYIRGIITLIVKSKKNVILKRIDFKNIYNTCYNQNNLKNNNVLVLICWNVFIDHQI